jgi:hypothetical protein
MTAPDSGFEGTSADTLPEASLDFSCVNSGVVNPDVVVDVMQNGEWVRIPVTGVEQWINKDGPADMTRTAKVTFPFEWGGHSIIQYINGFDSQNNASDQKKPYDVCRVFFYDEEIEEWQITHYGYIGGVGPATETGVGKFWVYDPADLMKGIQVSKSWGEPTLQNVLDFALRGTDEQGRPVGLEKRSVFDSGIGIHVMGRGEIPQRKQTDVREEDTQNFAITGSLPLIGSFRIPVPGIIGDIFNWVEENIVEPLLGGQKRFQINRHNMVDYMEWVSGLVDARWWFEPSPDGPVLVLDATAFKSGAGKDKYERRYFVEERLVEDGYSPPDKPVYGEVDTLNNSALADIKPFNTLYLYGESTTYRERYGGGRGYRSVQAQEDAEASTSEDMSVAASPGVYTEEYPFVKVQYPPLLDRAGGYEYSAQPVESDKVYLEEAKNQAVREFRKHIAEQSEGSMELIGDPHIMPFDYLVTVPTCNDTFRNANAPPMTWEVNGVKHSRMAGERYTTELGVSLTVDDSQLNVTAEYREA